MILICDCCSCWKIVNYLSWNERRQRREREAKKRRRWWWWRKHPSASKTMYTTCVTQVKKKRQSNSESTDFRQQNLKLWLQHQSSILISFPFILLLLLPMMIPHPSLFPCLICSHDVWSGSVWDSYHQLPKNQGSFLLQLKERKRFLHTIILVSRNEKRQEVHLWG